MHKILLGMSAFAVFGLIAPLGAPAKAEERVTIRERHDHPRFYERIRHHDFDRFRHHERHVVMLKRRGHEY